MHFIIIKIDSKQGCCILTALQTLAPPSTPIIVTDTSFNHPYSEKVCSLFSCTKPFYLYNQGVIVQI